MGKGLAGGKALGAAKLMGIPPVISLSPNTERARELVSSVLVTERVGEWVGKADVFPHHCLSHRGDEQQRKAPLQKLPMDPQRRGQHINLAVSSSSCPVPESPFPCALPHLPILFCTACLLTS